MVRKLFLTPPTLPSENVCRTVEIPSSQEWLGIFNNALLQTINPFNFEQVNDADLTPEAVAEKCYEIYSAWLSSECGVVPTAPTPFWDDDTDVDDDVPVAEQTWYGYVTDPEASPETLTFVEQFVIWTITGFLAVATWEVGAAPAILFNTIAPRFVIAVRRGEFGEIIRILVDGQEAARVDTSSASPGDVIRTAIVADPEFSTHDVYIIQVS